MLGPVQFLFLLFLKIIIYGFIQQGFIKWIHSDSENIYNVTKYFCFKQMLFIWTFYLTKNIKICIMVSSILISTIVLNIDNNKCFLSSKSAY